MKTKTQSILIVEDDEAIKKLYSLKLSSVGYDVSTAANGEEGLKALGKQQPELILLDLLMPVMGGEEMLEKFRSSSPDSETKVIILTNVSRDEAPLSLRGLGVDDYLVKALFTPTQIVEKISKVLDN